jgi:trigger factor
MPAGESTTFVTQLVGGDYTGRDADVAVTVRTVKEKQLPELDDEFAQLASEFDTLDELKEDLRTRLTRVKRVEQLYAARDKALDELVKATEVPAPDGIVREEADRQRQLISDQLERIGTSMDEYLEAEGKTEDQVDTELTEAATTGVKIQLVLDTLADAEEIQVSDDEFGHEIVHRAQRAGVAPQQYYDQIVRAGTAGAVYGDVRRGKALALVLERVKITDSAGNPVDLDALRGEAGDVEHDHEHDH